MSKASPLIFPFGKGQAAGSEELRQFVGGKGASLAEMTRAGLQVPPGFTLSTVCCARYYELGKQWPTGLAESVREHLCQLEQLSGRSFGTGADPLLVAVRSGAAQSMPGMMDTVLNVGLNPDSVRAIGEKLGQPRLAWQAYAHFVGLFGRVVAGLPDSFYDDQRHALLKERHKPDEETLSAEDMHLLCDRLQQQYRSQTGHAFPTDPWEMLLASIEAVFRSWQNERAVSYRQHHHIQGLLGTAVTVQMMCPSEVSGVLFTANPVNPALPEMILEASFGLGEAVVLGKVTPDRFVLDKVTLVCKERVIAQKLHIVRTIGSEGSRPAGASDEPCLTEAQVQSLAQLGKKVEAYFGKPCDIEWGWAAGEFYLLQAREIKAASRGEASAADRERVKQAEIDQLRAKAEPTGTVWSRYNLAEILPEPTPMTWSIVQTLMGVEGGYGLMYRDLGYDPDPTLGEQGIFDLVCGRPYCNLSREPRMYYRQLPFGHPFSALKATPAKALYPKPTFDPNRAGWRFWLGLPFILPSVMLKMMRAQAKQLSLAQSFAQTFREKTVPAYLTEIEQAEREDWSQLAAPELLRRLEHWRQRTLVSFARDSLKPTALSEILLGSVERSLTRAVGASKTQDILRQITVGVHPDPEADFAQGLEELASGRLERAQFFQRFGHRGNQEMELAMPRWSEQPDLLKVLPKSTETTGEPAKPSWETALADLPAGVQSQLQPEIDRLRTFLGMRETGKHYLLKGYALIRRALLEIDRRCQLRGGVFFLTLSELPGLLEGQDLSAQIRRAKEQRDLLLSLELPQVLFSDDLAAIGRPIEMSGASTLQGVPLSAGIAEGRALVLLEPTFQQLPTEPYILVCPSTDPAWVPLFAQAKGLLMETGGVLSHGAILAREYGRPAIAGLPEVQRRIKTGQRLRMDGSTGTVQILAEGRG